MKATNEITPVELIVPRDPILLNITSSPKFKRMKSIVNLEKIFARAVMIEEEDANLGHTYPDNVRAFEAYQDVLKIKPSHTPTLINLGTLYFNARIFETAKYYYIQATEADPQYTLAFFDLGNTYDELQDSQMAINCYLRALALCPGYADAHYNLALAYDRCGTSLKALKHWQLYCRLDTFTAGPWFNYAQTRLKAIREGSPLRLVTPQSELQMEHIALKRVYSRSGSRSGSHGQGVEQLWLALG